MSLKAIDGLPIIDAKKSLAVSVTEKDIQQADRKNPGCCAFARACERELHVKEARIHLGRVYLRTNQSNWVRYITPTTLRSEIIAFDRGGQFENGVFVLGAPLKTKKTTGKRKGSQFTSSNRKGRKRKSPHIIKNVRNGPAYG